MKTIFDPVKIGKKTAKNRLCRSATVEGLSPGGHISDKCVGIYRALAEGGVGLIVSGMTEVSESGCYVDSITAAHTDTYSEELRPIAEAAHANGALFCAQLSHSGIKARALPNPLLGPSDYEVVPGEVYARAMTADEIRGVVADFASAAAKAKAAGADGVQLHCAHGYLLSSFFSPYTNRRDDAYGGGFAGRSRLIFEVYGAVREAVGDDFIVGIKTNLSDMVIPTITPEEVVRLCRGLESGGLDFAEFSAGVVPADCGKGPDYFLKMPEREDEPIFYRSTAEIAEALSIPVYAVSGWRSPEVMERCLNESGIAGISMCTPFIREPALVARWMSGDRGPAKCISCMACEVPTRWAARCLPKPPDAGGALPFGCPIEKNVIR